MKASTLTMRVDPVLKAQAEELCAEMGLTLSTAYTMFLKAMVRTRSIPFPVTAESIAELEAGGGEEHELVEVE